MEHPPTPSPASTPSRRGSHIDTDVLGISSYPEHVRFRRDSRPSLTQDEAHRDFCPKTNGRVRISVEVQEESELNEASPLLPARTDESMSEVPSLPGVCNLGESSEEESWDVNTVTKEQSKSSWYLLLLTISFGGLQIAWSVELSNGSPYLLSLGISKSLLAFVWIAGPLSGTLVQPYVGIKSDRCRSRFGKRRPFMIGGAVATIISLIVLAWTREIIGGVLSIFGVSKQSEGTKITSIVLAVLMIYVLDFSINVIQAGIRAFVVDNSPTHQQDSANAWASRLMGMGNIIGYLFGYANLPKYLWFFGDTQFKVLCVIASLGLALTVAISCFFVRERDPRLEGEPAKQRAGVLAFFKTLLHSIRRLPPQIKNVCIVQLAAWVGWFPFLFYVTTYIGELYVDPIFRANPNMTEKEVDDAWQHGTRVGTFALLIYALVSFAASVALPWFICSSYKAKEPFSTTRMTSPLATRTRTTPSATAALTGEGNFDVRSTTINDGAVLTPDPWSIESITTKRKWLTKWTRTPNLTIPWLTLKRAWLVSHIMFAVLMWLTFIAHNTTTATILTGLVGIPWAMTMWAPFALIAAEISKRDNIRRGLTRPPPTRDGELLAQGEDLSNGADQAGIVLGIHNVAIAAPQIVATLVSSAIFKALQKPRGTVGDDSVAWVLRFGGILALVAAWLTRRIAEEGDEEGTPPKW